jgi:response regulator receiver domain-containing protein
MAGPFLCLLARIRIASSNPQVYFLRRILLLPVIVRWNEGATAMPQKPIPIDLHRRSSAGVHILLADDFAPWRSKLRSFLECETSWKIVFEAYDGIEAVQKTIELHPEVVLLDLSMPGLNGIEAARRIRHYRQTARLLFSPKMRTKT